MDDNFEKEMKQFGLAIKKLRESRRLTQEDVLNMTGIARSSLVDIEAGKRMPRGLNMLRLCVVFEISPTKLMEIAFKKWNYPVKSNPFFPSDFSQKNCVAKAKERNHSERHRKTTTKKDIPRSARSCGGGQKCYNELTIKKLKSNLYYTKVVMNGCKKSSA